MIDPTLLVALGARRVPVQSSGYRIRDPDYIPPGTITWEEHVEAWRGYAVLYGKQQTAERMAQRGGFGHWELTQYLGHNPKTWEAR